MMAAVEVPIAFKSPFELKKGMDIHKPIQLVICNESGSK